MRTKQNLRYRIYRAETLVDRNYRYVYRLMDTEKDKEVYADLDNRPVAPPKMRRLQASLNTNDYLDQYEM